jgi:hypothetical protein
MKLRRTLKVDRWFALFSFQGIGPARARTGLYKEVDREGAYLGL